QEEPSSGGADFRAEAILNTSPRDHEQGEYEPANRIGPGPFRLGEVDPALVDARHGRAGRMAFGGDEADLPDVPGIENAQAQVDGRPREGHDPGTHGHGHGLAAFEW